MAGCRSKPTPAARAGSGSGFSGNFRKRGLPERRDVLGCRFVHEMIRRLTLLFLALMLCAFAAEARPYVNDKKAPEDRKDIEVIQSALQSALPQARAATVCIELKEGSGSGVIVSADGLV